ncbi:hypothetical protein D3C72_657010 [compost metagenome]
MTTEVLQKSDKRTPKIFVGCAKWGRPDWVGKIYPKGTKEASFLKEYVKHFNSIELNATFYRIFDKNVVEKWQETAPDGFKFSPKFFQTISHIKRLKDVDELTKAYYESIEILGDKLGSCFLQLPENFGPKHYASIEFYLKNLRKDVPVFLELRSKDWFKSSTESNEAFEFFREQRIGMVITDAAGRRDCVHQHLTTPEAFIRFVGNSLHPTDYQRIDEWVQRIKRWLDQGLQTLHFFMHQHEEFYSPELCVYLIKALNKECGLTLTVPVLAYEKQKDISSTLF